MRANADGCARAIATYARPFPVGFPPSDRFTGVGLGADADGLSMRVPPVEGAPDIAAIWESESGGACGVVGKPGGGRWRAVVGAGAASPAARFSAARVDRETPVDVAAVGAPDVGAPDVGAPDVGAPDVGAPDVGLEP